MLKNTKMLDYMKEICDDLSEMGDDMSEMVGDIDDNRTQILKEYTEKKDKIQGMGLNISFLKPFYPSRFHGNLWYFNLMMSSSTNLRRYQLSYASKANEKFRSTYGISYSNSWHQSNYY